MCETAAVTLCCLKLIYYFAGSDFETLSVSHFLWRNVSTQFFTASFQFIEMCSIHSCTALSWCHHSTTNSLPSYMTQTGPRFCCWTDGLTSDSRMFWYTEDFMVKLVTTRCQIPVCAKKKAPKISPPPLCWQLVRGENGECFFQTWCFALWPFTLLRFCGLFRCSFADLSHAAMFFSDRRRFPSKQAIPLQSISTVVNCNI